MAVNYGSRRTVVGAHYGTRDWLAQRVTALLMALFTLVVLARFLLTSGPVGYDKWAGLFAAQPMKMLTFATIVPLNYPRHEPLWFSEFVRCIKLHVVNHEYFFAVCYRI